MITEKDKSPASSGDSIAPSTTHPGVLVAAAFIIFIALPSSLGACTKAAKSPAEAGKIEEHCRELLRKGEGAFARNDVVRADKYFKQALSAAEELGPDNRNVALALNDLALTTAVNSSKSGTVNEKMPESIAYQKRSLAIDEKTYGPENAYVAYDLNNLGAWYNASGQYREGSEVLLRAAKIREKVLGPKSLLLGLTLANLAENYIKQKRYAEAIELLKKTKTIYIEQKRPADAALTFDKLAEVLQDQGNLKEADGMLKEALSIREATLGKDDIMVAQTLNNLAVCLLQENKEKEAEPLFRRSLAIVQKGSDKEIIKSVMLGYGQCLDKLGKKAEAKKLGLSN